MAVSAPGFGGAPGFANPGYGGGTIGGISASPLASLPPAAQRLLLRRVAQQRLGQGVPDSGGGHHFFGFLDHLGLPGLALDQIATSLVHTPAAVVKIGKTSVNDLIALAEFAPSSDPRRQAANNLGLGIAHGIGQDFAHPLQNPGNLAMDVFNIGSLGFGAAARMGTAARAVSELKAARLPPTEPPLLPPGQPLPRPIEGGGGAAAPRMAPEQLAAARARQVRPEPTAPITANQPVEPVGFSDINHLETMTNSARRNFPAQVPRLLGTAEQAGLHTRLDLANGQSIPVRSVDEAVRAAALYPKAKIRFQSEPHPPVAESVTAPTVKPDGFQLSHDLQPSLFDEQPLMHDRLNLQAAEKATAPVRDVNLETLRGPTPERATEAEVSPAAPHPVREAEVKAEGKPVIAMPKVVADPESGFVGIEGRKLHVRPSPSGIPGRYRLHLGQRPIGPEIAGAKNAIQIMVQHHIDLERARLDRAAPIETVQAPPATHLEEPKPSDLKAALKETRTLPLKETRVTARGTGTTAREQGTTSRQMGVSQQHLVKAGLDTEQAKELTRRIAPEMRDAYQKAIAAGKSQPTLPEINRILQKHLPTDVARELFQRIVKTHGGAPVSNREIIGAIYKGLTTRRGTSLTRTIVRERASTTAVETGSPLASVVNTPGRILRPAEVEARLLNRFDLNTPSGRAAAKAAGYEIEQIRILASHNPLVKQIQAIQLGLLHNMAGRFGERLIGGGRTLESIMRLEKREHSRIENDADISKWGAEAAARETSRPQGLRGYTTATVDTMNQAAQIGVLYLKPSYYPANLIGQLGLIAVDHAFNPISIIKSVALQRELYGDSRIAQKFGMTPGELSGAIAARVKGGMQEGIVQSVAPDHGLPVARKVASMHKFLGKISNKLLDTPFRDNSFINEARRQGFDTSEKIADLVMNPQMHEQFIDVARRANRNIIDYGRMTSVEKQIVRRVIFFYPWMKAATIYGGHFFASHPGAAEILTQQGRIEGQNAQKELGPLPSYLEGVFKVGERDVPGIGKQPIIFNPLSETILGTPAQTIETAKELLTGNVHSANEPTQFLTPALSGLLAAVTHTDPFTGQAFPASQSAPSIFLNQLKQTPALTRLLTQQIPRAEALKSGDLSATKVLFPYTKGEAIGRFLGPGLADIASATGVTKTGPAGRYALNTGEARSRYFAEQKTFASKADRQKLTNQDYLRRYTEDGKKAGLFHTAPPALAKAFALRADQYANRELWAHHFGMNSNQIDPVVQLSSDLDLLVKRHRLSEQDASQILKSYGNQSPDKIRSFLRNLSETYFGAQVISYYKSQIKAVTGTAPTVP